MAPPGGARLNAFLARAHPAAKLLLATGLLVASVTIQAPALPALAALALALALAAAPRAALKIFPWVAGAVVLNAGIVALLAPPDGFARGLEGAARAALAFLAAWAVVQTTRTRDLLAITRRAPRVGLTLALVLRGMPEVARDFEAIRLARQARGVHAPAGMLGLPRATPLLAPLLVRAARRGRHQQDALRANGFDGSPRESYARMEWRATDAALVAAALVVACAGVVI